MKSFKGYLSYYLLGDVYVCTKVLGKIQKSLGHFTLNTNVNLVVALDEKFGDHPNHTATSSGKFGTNSVPIDPVDVEIF